MMFFAFNSFFFLNPKYTAYVTVVPNFFPWYLLFLLLKSKFYYVLLFQFLIAFSSLHPLPPDALHPIHFTSNRLGIICLFCIVITGGKSLSLCPQKGNLLNLHLPHYHIPKLILFLNASLIVYNIHYF